LDEDLEKLTQIAGVPLQQYGPIFVAGGLAVSDRIGGNYNQTPQYWMDCWKQPAVNAGVVVKVHNVKFYDTPTPIYDGCVHIWTQAIPSHSSTRELRSSSITKLELNDAEYKFVRDYDHGYCTSLGPLKEIFDEHEEYTTVCDSKGRLFAIVCPFNAFIPINMTSIPSRDGTARPNPSDWAPFADAIIAAVTHGDLNSLITEQRIKKNAQTLREFESMCMGKHAKRIEDTRKVIQEKHEAIIRRREEITDDLRKLTEFNEVLAIAEAIEPDSAVFQEEFSKILIQPQVDQITIQDDKLVIKTKMIWIDGDTAIRTTSPITAEAWAGKTIPLGEFEISMNAKGHIDFRNLTNHRVHPDGGSKWWHPHIPDHGACLGTIESVLPKMLAAYEFGSAASLVISYLQCCDADDGYGKNVFLWADCAINKADLGSMPASAA
jgi:hypothetical protein